MERYMVHLKNSTYGPKDASKLLSWARRLSEGTEAIIRDTRVSNKYLEFDVSIKKELVDSLLQKLAQINPLDHARHIAEEEISREDSIAMGKQYFNSERFWEAHEALEAVWKNAEKREKRLWQGIILAAAAFVHHQKDEDSICFSIMGRALEKLSGWQGTTHGINTDEIKTTINDILQTKTVYTFKI